MGNVLKEHGIEPAPDRQRQTTWATSLKAHWDVLAALDFSTIEFWIIEPGEEVGQIVGKVECRRRLGGLIRYYYREAA